MGDGLHYLLLYNKLFQNLAAQITIIIYYPTVSVGQKFVTGLA